MYRQLSVVLGAFAMVWFSLNRPAEQIHVTRELSEHSGITTTAARKDIQLGGFPWTYCEYHDLELHRWSWATLGWNIGVGVSIATALGFAVWRSVNRSQSSAVPNLKSNKVQLSLNGILLLVVCLAGPLAYYRYGHSRLNREFAIFAHRGCSCQSEIDVPAWLGNSMDVGFLMRMKTGYVDCDALSADEYRAIANIESLTSLQVSGANAGEISQVAALPQLTRLTLRSCILNHQDTDAIAGNGALRFITISLPEGDDRHLKELWALARRDEGWQDFHVTLALSANQRLHVSGVNGLTRLGIAAKVRASGLSLIDLHDLHDLRITGEIDSLRIGRVPKLRSLELDYHAATIRNLEIRDAEQLSVLGLHTMPEEVSLKNLPSLIANVAKNDERSGGGLVTQSGIRIGNGELNLALVESFGEFSRAMRFGGRVTMAAFAELLSTAKRKVVDVSWVRLRVDPDEPEVEFDELPELPHIRSFTFPHSRSCPADLYKLLGKTPNLDRLVVNQSFGDEHVPMLTGLFKLRVLHLVNSSITGEGLVNLPRLPMLEELTFPHEVRHVRLRGFPKLKKLDDFVMLRPETIELLDLPSLNLKWLECDRNVKRFVIQGVGSVAKVSFAHIPDELDIGTIRQREVSLAGTFVTDRQLPDIVSPSIEILDLSGTTISDSSTEFLLSLKHLKVLNLSSTGFTAEQLDRLREKSAGRIEKIIGSVTDPILDSAK